MSMSPLQNRMIKILAIAALLGVPLLCGELYFRFNAPGEGQGVYLETDRNYKATLRDSDRGLYTLAGYATNQPGAAREAFAKSPVPKVQRLAFFMVGPPDSPLIANAPSAGLWCYVVDPEDDEFRSEAVSVPATIQQINPGAYRVNSPEIEQAWSADRIAYQQYDRALKRRATPRARLDVMMGLEVQDSASGPKRMYSVRVGPPR
jgi:hypothetical protein